MTDAQLAARIAANHRAEIEALPNTERQVARFRELFGNLRTTASYRWRHLLQLGYGADTLPPDWFDQYHEIVEAVKAARKRIEAEQTEKLFARERRTVISGPINTPEDSGVQNSIKSLDANFAAARLILGSLGLLALFAVGALLLQFVVQIAIVAGLFCVAMLLSRFESSKPRGRDEYDHSPRNPAPKQRVVCEQTQTQTQTQTQRVVFEQ